MIITVAGVDVPVSPTGAKALRALAAHDTGDGPLITPTDVHPAVRDSLIAAGLINVIDYAHGVTPPQVLALTALGRRVTDAIETGTR